MPAYRRASEPGYEFPYTVKRTCWLEHTPAGPVELTTKVAKRAALARARQTDQPILFAVLTGVWKAELFVLDDLDRVAEVIGAPTGELITGG